MPETYDLIIRHATLIDGSGAPRYAGDLAIRGERIVAMGTLGGVAPKEIDATGLIVSPGFIDMHSHADLNVLQYPAAENCIMQGCTTVVVGNCGMSAAPLNDYLPFGFEMEWWFSLHPRSYGPPSFLPLAKHRQEYEEQTGVTLDWQTFGEWVERVEGAQIAVNMVPLVGHNTLRLAAMGEDSRRPARPEELRRMAGYIQEAMEAGAFGFSTGLDYMTGEYSDQNEVTQLTRVAGRRGGLYFTHTRFTNNVYPSADLSEDPGLGIYHGGPELMSVGRYRGFVEAIETARSVGIPMQIAHISNAYIMPQPHSDEVEAAMVRATLELIDRANSEGLDIHFDIIPNVTGPFNQPPLLAPFWKWLLLAGSKEQFVANLRLSEFRDELRAAMTSGRFLLMMLNPATDIYWAERTTVLGSRIEEYVGQTIAAIAQQKKTDVIDALLDVLAEDPDAQYQNMVDIRTTAVGLPIFLRHPTAMIGLDQAFIPVGWQIDDPVPGWNVPHPNNYGGFPHFITTYARDMGVMTLEEAVHKCAGLPARKLGLRDRGLLRPGAYADIVIFDYERLENRSQMLDPHHAPAGIQHVLVNGAVVWEGQAATSARSGMVLRRANA